VHRSRFVAVDADVVDLNMKKVFTRSSVVPRDLARRVLQAAAARLRKSAT
jgi:hypothetical protein